MKEKKKWLLLALYLQALQFTFSLFSIIFGFCSFSLPYFSEFVVTSAIVIR